MMTPQPELSELPMFSTRFTEGKLMPQSELFKSFFSYTFIDVNNCITYI
jgi:hypothetical protein